MWELGELSPRSGVTVLLRSITADVGELLPRAPPRSVYTLGLATRTKRVTISPARGVMVPLFGVAGQIGASYFGGKTYLGKLIGSRCTNYCELQYQAQEM